METNSYAKRQLIEWLKLPEENQDLDFLEKEYIIALIEKDLEEHDIEQTDLGLAMGLK